MLKTILQGAGGLVGGGITPPAGDTYWIVEVSGPTIQAKSATLSDGSVVGSFEQGSNTIVVSLDANGNANWQKSYAYSTYDVSTLGIIADSSDNIYFSGTYDEGGGNGFDAKLIKLSGTDGSILAQTGLYDANYNAGYNLAIDSSGNITQALYINDGTTFNGGVAKYASNLSLQWQTYLDNGTTTQGYFEIATDSSDNIYAGGFSNDGSYNRPLLSKFNSSGTVQWSYVATNSISTTQNNLNFTPIVRGLTTDDSGNIYAILISGLSTSDPFVTKPVYVVKFNSSGTVQWQKRFTPISAVYPGQSAVGVASICLTQDGVLVAQFADSAYESKYSSTIFGINPSDGSLSWQTNISTSNSIYGNVSAHPTLGWCFVGAVLGGTSGFIARLPDDGSLTGNWGNILYKSATWNAGTGSLIFGDPSLTQYTASLTEDTPVYTSSTSSYTLTKTTNPLTIFSVTATYTDGFLWNSSNRLDVLSKASVGDLVVIAVSANSYDGGHPIFWGGMNFTTIINQTRQENPVTYVGYRIVQSGDTNPYLSSGDFVSDSSDISVVAAIFSQAEGFNTYVNSGYSNSIGSNLDPPSVTATAGLWIVTGHIDDDYNVTFTPPSGYTMLDTATSLTSSVTSSTGIAYKIESLTSENPGIMSYTTSAPAGDNWYATTVAFS